MAMPAFIFETPRLRARHIEAGDVDAMLAVYGDAEVVRWVADGLPLDRTGCERWVEVTHRNYATRGYGMVALLDRPSAAIIGFCGLVHPSGQTEPELKYALRRDQWGKGLATEAAAALLAYSAATFGISRVIATTAPQNTASHSVLLKVGMQRGELRRNADGSFTQLFVWHPSVQHAENAL
jgi:ribosomal-protein-alanine N-acetyltransferase